MKRCKSRTNPVLLASYFRFLQLVEEDKLETFDWMRELDMEGLGHHDIFDENGFGNGISLDN